MGRPALDHDAKRLEIAEATCKTIVERGLNGIKLRNIAAQLGVTTGSLQHYYETKEDLLQHAKELLVDRKLSRCQSAVEDKAGVDRLRAMCETLLPTDQEGIDMWQIVVAYAGQAIGDEEAMQIQVTRYSRAVDMLAAEIKKLQMSGDIDAEVNPKMEAFSLLSFIEGMANHVVFSPERYRRPYQRRMLARYLNNVLGKPFD